MIRLKLLKRRSNFSKTKIILCPSFTSIKEVSDKISGHMIDLGSQNVHHSSNGAYTGEISVDMLKEIECEWVILGHSERRQYFTETNQIIKQKSIKLIQNNIVPIICIGETLEEKNRNAEVEKTRKYIFWGGPAKNKLFLKRI